MDTQNCSFQGSHSYFYFVIVYLWNFSSKCWKLSFQHPGQEAYVYLDFAWSSRMDRKTGLHFCPCTDLASLWGHHVNYCSHPGKHQFGPIILGIIWPPQVPLAWVPGRQEAVTTLHTALGGYILVHINSWLSPGYHMQNTIPQCNNDSKV